MDLERAIEIAVQGHKGKVDKGGSPYIMQPLAVMFSLSTDDERIVAVLHDVVEDTDWTFEMLAAEGFSEAIIEALKSVTKDAGDKDYFAFVQRAKDNPMGRQVKIADLKHNMDVTRIKELTEKDMARLSKYKKALELLIKDT